MIEVRDVTKTFKLSRQQKREMGHSFDGNSVDAVAGISFTCQPGRIFSLLGPNGAGKTTTLRMIATMLRPSAGTIVVNGHDAVRDPEGVRASLGFLTGSTQLYDRLTPRELVRYVADLHRVPRDVFTKRRDEIFDSLDMGAYADRRIGKLSTGMKQKVSIARTVIHDPDVLVLDEATAGLDVIASRSIVELVRRARDRGKTVLFSTHRMGEVGILSDDLALIHRGRLLFNGTYASFTAEMTGATLEDEFIRRIEGAHA
ncbi:MAG TPA: ATP-binding cassette domain-containing protein [Candidatus Krumholzibacteria bacterium]|nr:ATP-binding cassette domain-containing protein [Candidatus Krumholzibacteria bacterium]